MPAESLGELGLVEQPAEQLVGQLLDVVVLHVEAHEDAVVARPLEQRSGRMRRLTCSPSSRVEGPEAGASAVGLMLTLDARQRAVGVVLEAVVGLPRRVRGDHRVEQLGDPAA